MMKFVAAAAIALAASGASASVLTESTATILDEDKLFTTEVKMDQTVIGGAQSGHDIFVREGATFTGASTNKRWTNGATYHWMLSYDGDVAMLDVGGTTVSYDVRDGSWNALKLITRAQNRTHNSKGSLFDDAETSVTISEVNGTALASAWSQTSGLDEYTETTLTFGGAITSVKGTLTFAWDAGDWDKNPNSRMAFIVKGAEIDMAPVPLPAGAPLLVAGLGAFAAVRRRAR